MLGFKEVTWELSVSQDEAVAVLQQALHEMGGNPRLDPPAPLAAPAIRARTPESRELNRPDASWQVFVLADENRCEAHIRLDVGHGKHEELLDELAQRCGSAVRSRGVAQDWDWRAIQRATDELQAKRVVVKGKGARVTLDPYGLITVRRGLGNSKSYAVDEHVEAVVETAGQLSARPTFGRTATGMVIAGPLGALLGATAWKSGTLFLALQGSDWAELVEVDQRQAKDALRLAQEVNLLARQLEVDHPSDTDEADAPPPVIDAPPPVIDQLERLANLRDRGALTDEEFEEQKRRLLSSP
jgi:Short C-terminal domain